MPQEFSQTLQAIRQPGRSRNAAIIFACAWLAILGMAFLIQPLAVFAIVLITVALVGCAVRPDIPMYIMAAFFPFVFVQITAGDFNAPVGDLVGVFALGALALRLLWFVATDPRRIKEFRFPGIWFYAAWVCLALATTFFHSWDVALSVKYIIRFVAFFYPVFVFLLVNSIRSEVLLRRMFLTMFTLGVVAGMYALYGFVAAPVDSFVERRAIPIPLFGIYPLGENHNAIAGLMLTVIPIGIYLLFHTKNMWNQKLLFVGIAIQVLTTLLTFSRSGWIVLGVEAVVLFFLQYRHHLHHVLRTTIITTLILLPVIAYMIFFSSQYIVKSSNESRSMLNENAYDMFLEHPLMGSGPGLFRERLWHNGIFLGEFGFAVEAHGYVAKVGSELGILGLLFYGGMLFSFAFILYKTFSNVDHTNRSQSWLITCAVLLFVESVCFHFFHTYFYEPQMWFPIGLALAAAYIAQHMALKKKKYV